MSVNGTLKIALTLLAALALGACAPQVPSRGVATLDRPLSDDYLQIVSVDDHLVEIDSAGRIVRAAAPEGLCIPRDSVQTGPDAVFLIMSDCPLPVGDAGPKPGALGGVLSVSVAKGPVRDDLPTLKRFFESAEGVSSLGYGGGADDVSLLDLRLVDGVMTSTVEDRSDRGPGFAGDVICRAFTELNGRRAVISLISRNGDARPADELRRQIGRVVETLRAANEGAAAIGVQSQQASSDPSGRGGAAQPIPRSSNP